MNDGNNTLPPRSEHPNQPSRLWIWTKRSFSFMLTVMILGVVCSVLFLFYLRAQALPVSTVLQTSSIVDIHGEVIDSFHAGQHRDLVTLDEISPDLVHATLAIEDRRFYDHFGIDLKGTLRAVLINLKNMSKVQGASTITQQLSRNLYLTHDRTWSRKMKEAMYALQLEMQYGKDVILEKYLNQIYFGHATYGVQAAAQMFFGKDASELTLAESALMAGVPKGPGIYSPYINESNAKDRQKVILEAMAAQGYITEEEAAAAYQEDLNFQPLQKLPEQAPYFRDYIQHIAVQKLGISEQELSSGGVTIYTTLDLRAQKIAEEVIQQQLEKADEEMQAALIAIDPRNGHVKAMVGGRDYADNQFNRVFATTRQPGSSFKPIVYLTALQQDGFSPVTQFKSEPTVFTYDQGRKTYKPQNFGNKYPNDYIDLRQAVAHSDNIYAVQTIMHVGEEKVIETARKMGIHSKLEPLPSLALGTFPVSPFEMASAFGVIANQGTRVEPVAILKITDSQGNIVYEAKTRSEKVFDPAYTYVTTQLMESVFDPGGTGYRVANVIKRPAAAKTGTTNTDAWMVGFTPELSTAVWVGYDRGRNISTLESYYAAPIFAEFIERTLEPVPPKLFPIPEGVTSVYIDPETGKLAGQDCPQARLETFVKGTEPVEFCTLHGAHEDNEKIPAQPVAEEEERTWWEDVKRWWSE